MKSEDENIVTEDLLRKKADYFFHNSLVVHVTMKMSEKEFDTVGTRYYNGVITEISTDFFILKDRFVGKLPIFFLQVKDIRLFTEGPNEDTKR